MHVRAEEQPEELREQSTDEQDVMSGPEEVRAGRGSAGLVRGRDERRLTDEASGKGKGKGNGGNGEHGCRGELRSKGGQQIMRMTTGEDEEKDEHEQDERVQVPPYMGAGSYPRPRQTRKKKSGSARKASTAKRRCENAGAIERAPS